MTVSSGSLLRAIRVPSRSENSRWHRVQRNRSMCLCVPVHDRCLRFPAPGRLKHGHCGFGHENRLYLSGAGVVCVMVVPPLTKNGPEDTDLTPVSPRYSSPGLPNIHVLKLRSRKVKTIAFALDGQLIVSGSE